MTIEAAPIAVDPSGDFLGVDGAWSTFSITVGTPPQQLQVLASTEVASTWVIVVDGCGPNDAANCTQARGGEYNDNKSSSWNPKAIFQLGAEDNLGYSGNAINGSYGYDTIGLLGKAGANNVSVNHQVIAGLITEAFYVGSLGLSNQPINFTDSGDSSPSLLTSLKNENLIPSTSYGYTAGASYQPNGGVGASLTLGGYDASRFTPNDISFTFAPTVERQLVVAIQSITYSNKTTQTPLLSEGIVALVDSTVPYLWLPQQACSAFESAFGITWDELHSLYLVNDTLHERLVQENPSVTFQLANSLTGPSVNITLPYSSFDLVAQYPLVLNTSRYFPLQRAPDDNSYTLGRTLLQESFLIVDYENSNFSISQATFNQNTPSHIVAISSTSTTGGNPSNPSSSSTTITKTPNHNSSGVSTGAIAGIAIAIVLVASLVGAFFLRKMLRRRRVKKLAESHGDPEDAPDMLDIQKRYSSEDPEVEYKKPAIVTVMTTEVPMTPPCPPEMDTNTMEYFGPKRASSQRIELPGSPVNRSELSSPEPAPRSGASSPDPNQLRSELSTPEPMYSNPELPTPDPSHELPSPALSTPGFGAPSNGDRQSALHSPLPIQRPTSDRFDSSESEAGFTRDGMPTRPFLHRRFGSDESGISSASSRPSNLHLRMDSSSSSEAFIYSNNGPNAGDSSDPDSITPAATTTNKDHNKNDNKVTHLDSPTSASDTDTNTQNIHIALSPSFMKTHNLHRNRITHVESSSESEAPTTSTARRVTLSTFHSSSSSRPALRRVPPRSPTPQTPARTQTQGQRDSVNTAGAGSRSDSEAWQTRLESPSEESGVSRFGSLKRLGRRK